MDSRYHREPQDIHPNWYSNFYVNADDKTWQIYTDLSFW